MLIKPVVTATAAFLLWGCAGMAPTAPTTITDTVARTPELSTFNKLITTAGLGETLRGPGPYTVFAPTDAAFKAVPTKAMDELAANPEMLRSVLRSHVLPGKVMATDVKVGELKTLQGPALAVANAGSALTVEDAVVLQADMAATNGVVHVIDRVLMPQRR